MKLQQNATQYFITLPAQLVRAKGWQKGDQLTITIDREGNLVIKKPQ